VLVKSAIVSIQLPGHRISVEKALLQINYYDYVSIFWHSFPTSIVLTIKINFMPQKHHEKAAEHLEQAAKHHRSASKHASEGNYERAAHLAQAAHGHHRKAKEYAGKAAMKYAERAGSMKKEDLDEQEMEGAGFEDGLRRNR
jgi:hypothetical protein